MSQAAETFEPVMEDPPKRSRGGDRAAVGVWVDRLKKCVRKPGRWFRVWECDTAVKATEAARNIRDGRVKLPPGRWDAKARAVDGRFFVYAVYEGPDE